MLILHPSSRCDVCLDAYTWQTIAQTPHAIPCGHVFCRPCLFALSPYICPLCRKRFEPNKAKKLHVDRPENVDENRENDLLQRLTVSWEAPEDQLRALTFEVDTWLDTRADDTCIVLRKARAALARHLELKKVETTLENDLADVRARCEDMELNYNAVHRQAVATEAKLKADNNALIRENEELKAEVKVLRTASEQHSLKKNPLPRPPKPISTDYIPTFPQAMAQDRVRFNLPSGSPYAQSFEVESRKRHKGKVKSQDHRLISPTSQHPHPLPTQLPKMDPSEEPPALISHFGHDSPRQCRISTPAPSSGLKLYFENTNQPLDLFELTHTYLREYSQGVLDGQLMAGKGASRSSTFQQPPHASTSHSHGDVSLPDTNESIETRSMRSNQAREIQPIAGPSIVDRSSRFRHERQNTVSSIATSAESSSIGQRPQNDSRSRSRTSLNQFSHPSLAALLSNSTPQPSAPSRRPMASLPTAPPNPSPNPSIPSLTQPQPSQGIQPEPPLQPRTESPTMSHLSKSSWGTIISTSTNLTSYSLLGLRDFREFSYPQMVGSEAGTPASRVSSMVGVIPAHETVGGSAAASPRSRGRNDSRTQRLSQYPPPSLTSWHGSVASLSPGQTPDQFPSSNGYHSDDENENVVRSDELLHPNYSRDSTGSHPMTMESQRVIRGRNQPLPAVSPSFPAADSVTAEEDDRSNRNIMETFGNALGLELTTGPTPISAPTPIVPHQSFLRSFSDET
ncbi:hypothetical protein BYT27DRAFT_7193308 [Phlegmacium glaucopus]|nr:hypothetical protein BYT27DRAFT_7193308 [Phlegmacium glaucopus]